MNTEEHDDLWCLLGKAKTPEVSPFFSRNVLRSIREERQEKVGLLAWVRQRWQVVAVGTCALLIASFALNPPSEQPDHTTMLLAEKVSQSADYQVISDLDELLASEESSVWLEN